MRNEEPVREDLVTLWAVVEVLRQLETDKEKAIYLRNTIIKKPRLVHRLRDVYEPGRHYALEDPPEGLDHIIQLLTEKDLRCGLRADVVARVFDKMGLPPLVDYTKEVGFWIEIINEYERNAVALFYDGDYCIANMQIGRGKKGAAAINKLRNLGIRFIAARHIKDFNGIEHAPRPQRIRTGKPGPA